MVFSSMSFLFMFFPVLIILYFSVKGIGARNAVLLVFSLLFYSWGEPRYIILLIAATSVAYVGGMIMNRYLLTYQHSRLKTAAVTSSVIIIANLFVFKYFNFFSDNLLSFVHLNVSIPRIILPIGISFYTFQILSYIIDLYHGRIKVQKSFCRLLLYVSFFPQLIAGPIVRYSTVETELSRRMVSADDVDYGIKRFITGLSKKVIIANNIARVAEIVYSAGNSAGTAAYWIAAFAYTLQIYYDFSGYSDMAIGLGRIFGFHFLENFNYPYISRSVTEFWRRWHISLSNWFRDYVYIPMGGNKVSRGRWILNYSTVWLLTGIWHGADWNFIMWGLYYLVILLLEKLFLNKLMNRVPPAVSWAYTLFIVTVGWVIFNFTDLSVLSNAVHTMFSFSHTDFSALFARDIRLFEYMLYFIPGIVFMFPVAAKVKHYQGILSVILENGIYFALFGICVMFLISSKYNPFIYFRF